MALPLHCCMQLKRAAALQSEVLTLKQELGTKFHPKKAGPHQPFPLSLVFDLDLPDTAFDLSQLQVLW